MDVDVLVVGSGLAGLTTALSLAGTHNVVVMAKHRLEIGASDWAQGGIAAVLDSADSIAAHVQDTLVAGAYLGDLEAVERIVTDGPAAIDWLIAQGARFTPDPRSERGYHLTREGGHAHRRIIHAADATGHAVLSRLIEQARQHPRIALLENHQAVELRTEGRPGQVGHRCTGLQALDLSQNALHEFKADHVVLACGGAGKVYRHTSNPDTATGDGMALAWRAGCRLANMEFIQFHPTCLHHADARSFLISEALRGEGAILTDRAGRRFMPAHDARAELAPRDVVARAIDQEMKQSGADCVFLNISHQPADFIREHFPMILARCASLGIDITREPIPVVPAAHYTCGGVVTDALARTDVPGLYAVGETAYTGLHGANRLASNSLLECVVMGRAAAHAISTTDSHIGRLASGSHAGSQRTAGSAGSADDADDADVVRANLDIKVSQWREALQQTMSRNVGIVRDDAGLHRAARELDQIKEAVAPWRQALMRRSAGLDLCNLCDVAGLIVAAALSRRESRGAHYNVDWPRTLPKGLPSVLMP